MNDALRNVLKEYLRDGERVLWEGMPVQGIWLGPADLILIPFSLLWCFFAVAIEAAMIATGAPFFAHCFGIPFVLIGLYFVFGRLIHRAWSAKRTGYAVTDQRVIMIESGGVTTLPICNIPSLEIRSSRKGLGAIYFDPWPLRDQYWNPNSLTRQYHPNDRITRKAFVNIENVHEVYRLIDSLMNS